MSTKEDVEGLGSLKGDCPEDMLRCAYKEAECFQALLLKVIDSHLEKSLILMDKCIKDTETDHSVDLIFLHMYRWLLYTSKNNLLLDVVEIDPKPLECITSTDLEHSFKNVTKDGIHFWTAMIKKILHK